MSLKGVKKPLGVVPIGGDASLTHLREAIKANIEQQYLPPRFAFVGQAGQVAAAQGTYFPVASFNGKIQIMPKAVGNNVQKKNESWFDETLSKSVLMTDSQYGETLDYGSIQLKAPGTTFRRGRSCTSPRRRSTGGRPPRNGRKKYDPLTPDPATIPDEYKVVQSREGENPLASVDWDELMADFLIELNKFTQPAATVLQKYARRMCPFK